MLDRHVYHKFFNTFNEDKESLPFTSHNRILCHYAMLANGISLFKWSLYMDVLFIDTS